jgi:hypothetical protein
LILDLIDHTSSEADDETDYPPDFVADVFKTCQGSGSPRNDVTDFVWCMENRINSSVHNDAFPRGPAAPTSIYRSATNPSDWDPQEIRDVWLKNVR